jgi:hypothetical protein
MMFRMKFVLSRLEVFEGIGDVKEKSLGDEVVYISIEGVKSTHGGVTPLR